MKLGVAPLPALLINNEVVFDNMIPSTDALCSEIEKNFRRSEVHDVVGKYFRIGSKRKC